MLWTGNTLPREGGSAALESGTDVPHSRFRHGCRTLNSRYSVAATNGAAHQNIRKIGDYLLIQRYWVLSRHTPNPLMLLSLRTWSSFDPCRRLSILDGQFKIRSQVAGKPARNCIWHLI